MLLIKIFTCNTEIEMSLILSSWNTWEFASHWILEMTKSVVLSRYVSWDLFPCRALLWPNLMTNCFHTYLQKMSDSLFSLQPSNPGRFYSFSTFPGFLLVVEREIILFLQIRDKFDRIKWSNFWKAFIVASEIS